MKNTVSVGSNSNQVLDSHVSNTETKSPVKIIAKFAQIALFSIVVVFFCSCDRSSASGCGTWPMANGGGHKVNKGMYKSNQPSLKNNKQYAYYKHYN